MLKKYLKWSSLADRQAIVLRLQDNKLAAGSSDTVLGLIGACTQSSKIQIDTLKGRPSSKPYIILIKSLDELTQWSDALQDDSVLQDLLIKAWPGPLTILVKANNNAPAWAQSEQGTVAFRLPKHEGLQWLLAAQGMLLSTSANISGAPTPHNFTQLDKRIIGFTGIPILDNPLASNDCASTLLDCTSYPYNIIRQGAYSYNAADYIKK